MREPKRWQVQEAKAKLSELLRAVQEEGPQIISQRGVETVVVERIDDWKSKQPKEDLIDVLLSGPTFELEIPDRHSYRWRKPVKF